MSKANGHASPKRNAQSLPAQMYRDLTSLRWMVNPASSARLLILAVSLHVACTALGVAKYSSAFLSISYPLPLRAEDASIQRYGKGPKDLCFLVFYILVFSLIRQGAIQYFITPLARLGGISNKKLDRFNEQGYALLYWSASSIVGLYVMAQQPTWWYNTSAFWVGYPHWRMAGALKWYYLLQFSYWLQQLLVLVLRLEKPRSDFKELCLHHIVTLWLIGWSWAINLTYIGVAIFFSMDIADVFLAGSKLLNYLQLQRTSEVSFAALLCVWTYFRHWQNLRILYSVWTEYDVLVPEEARIFDLPNGTALCWWMKYQVFAPILALQFLNFFWYVLMWRIVVRMLNGNNATDVREEDEDDKDD